MDERANTSSRPQVAIIVPVFNDQNDVVTALDSCMAQTLTDIEFIVVDDASTDETTSIVERYARLDKRVRLIRLETNQTAFQARRAGIEAATAPFILFLDGDDELVPESAATALALARERSADVVGFGCKVIRADGSKGSRHEASMQPKHKELLGAEILHSLFPVGKTAQGQLWRYLFDRDLLVSAYASLPSSLRLVRVNDLPIAFLALMRAKKYVSTPHVLYHYFFQRGASGHLVADIDAYEFNASAIDSIDSIAQAVANESRLRPEQDDLDRTYKSVRLSVIGRVLDYVKGIVDIDLQATCLQMLQNRVGRSILVYACADFCEKAFPLLASGAPTLQLSNRIARRVLLRTANLGTGGVQGVLVAQAAYLVKAGFEVMIAVDAGLETPFHLPDGVELKRIAGSSRAEKLTNYVDICRAEDIDVIIDHHILYNEYWPYFALSAAEEEIPTIGWLHNFALRTIHDGTTRTSFLEQYLPILAMTVVLSESDVAYWKLLGLRNVIYLPNPASPFIGELPEHLSARPAPTGPIEIVWWGRLQQSTKQVRELIGIGAVLRDLDVAFRITIIGPDSRDLTAAQLREDARSRGIEDCVVLPGPLHHDALLQAISQSDVYVSTSVIEGYPLALLEAQSVGLPLVMYELPWLATIRGNTGVVSVPQYDRRGAALALAALANDPTHYADLSEGSLAAARSALSHDFTRLYADLVRGEVAPVHSPEPSITDAKLLIEQNVRFSERFIRRERRALDRARADIRKNEKTIRRLEQQLQAARGNVRSRQAADRRNAPSVPRTGFRGWLMNFLPASMRQASFYARHQYNASIDQREQILRGQAAIDERLARMDAALGALRRDAENSAASSELLIQDRVARLEMAIIASQPKSLDDPS